jgi:4-amino-4-deoxy-L-arabinose transferase-like glycosyltransferase
MNRWKEIALLAGLVAITGLPFVHRAYFVDDYYHMQMARGILSNPVRPYDFRTDDAGINVPGWERGHWPRMVNPPLFHYMMAGVMRVWGDQVWKLRTASLLFSFVTLVCMYFLGQRFVSRPFAAASLLAITPAYWLTSYSLLIDSALIAFFMASLLVWIVALERRRVGWVLAAGALMGLTILVKYFGVLILPVTFVWQWLEKDRREWLPGYWAYAVCLLQLLWGAWNIATYGQMHFLATLPRGGHISSVGGLIFIGLLLGALFLHGRWFFGKQSISKPLLALLGAAASLLIGIGSAGSVAGWVQTFYIDKVVVLGAFIGGTTVFIWFAIWRILRDDWKPVIPVTLLMVGLAAALHSRIGGFNGQQSIFLAGGLGITVLFLIRASVPSLSATSTHQRFLLIWMTLALLELIGVMPWTAGRYLLLLLPPMIWSFINMLEACQGRRCWTLAWIGTASMGLLLAISDYQEANTIQRLADRLAGKKSVFEQLAPRPHHWYYLADTFDGSQPYLLPLGWENVFPHQEFKPGDLFLKARYRKSSWWTMAHPERFQLVMAWEMTSKIPLRVMDVPASAGFYASCWGALPYAVTNHPLERFELYQVRDVKGAS